MNLDITIESYFSNLLGKQVKRRIDFDLMDEGNGIYLKMLDGTEHNLTAEQVLGVLQVINQGV